MEIRISGYVFEMSVLNYRKVKSTFVGYSQKFSYKYIILVENKIKRTEETFEFRDSIANFEKGIKISKERQFAEVLSCVLRDALCVEECDDILDFMDNFGYTNNRECRKAYNGCKAEREQLHNLGIFNFAELLEELEEKYDL